MKQWFARFTVREQLSLLALALALGVFFLYHLIWSPLSAARDDMAQRNVSTARILQEVNALASEIVQRRDLGGARPAARSITALVNQSSLDEGLSITRLQPGSSGDVQVRLEGVAFDALLRWLHRLESEEGALITELSLSELAVPGRVNVTVRVAGSG